MKFRPATLGFLRSLLALSVSLAVVGSSQAFVFAVFNNPISQVQLQKGPAHIAGGSDRRDEEALSATALVTDEGVRIEWSTRFDNENLGFNVYRLHDGQRVRLNREIIPGSVFAVAGIGAIAANDSRLSNGSSYGWLDRQGAAGSVYYIESVTVAGASRFHEQLTAANDSQPRGKQQVSGIQQAETHTAETTSESTGNSFREVGYPAAAAPANPVAIVAAGQRMVASTIENQWSIAAQSAVKIAIRKDGWYRVTQPQMAAVGFNPTVDVSNLQLFVDGQEVAISTSQSGGLFGPADYIEFFGRGLDVPTSGVRTYYLIAAASPGKRVRGELQIDSPPTLPPSPQASPSSTPSSSPVNGAVPKSSWSAWRWNKLTITAGHPIGMPFIPLIIWRGDRLSEPLASAGGPEKALAKPESEPPGVAGGPSYAPVAKAAQTAQPDTLSLWEREGVGLYGRPRTLPIVPLPTGKGMQEMSAAAPSKISLRTSKKKKRGKKHVRRKPAKPRREYSHAVAAASVAPSSFQYTIERKDRSVYFSSLQNGATENFFGQVISTTPVSQTINTPNPAAATPGPARLEIRLQGVNAVTHQVSVKFNEVQIGTFTFFGNEGSTKTFDVPLSLLQNGANTIKFTPATGGDVSLVDYARITYPHAFRADANVLHFNLLGTQTLQVDGFSVPDIRLIDYTDPLSVSLTRPEVASVSGGFAITVPAGAPMTKTQRLLYATAAPAEQPAAISLNHPSTLNLNSNGADFLIITTNNLSPHLAPLVAARQAQGMSVAVVDVENVYDEFGYGLHGPQALKDFLARANTVWTNKPEYIVFAGDASYDPRNYLGLGNFDLVPTKLIDATYNETASDDWLADFDNDGVADIPVGRLPLRTPAEVDLVVSKIVNFAPLAPESAMLVADDPTGYYFNFELANDQVEAQLPGSMAVQRVNVRLDGPAAAKTNIIAGFNQGRALVNYTGHGNVDVWSGAAIFKTADATALTNGNRLSFVIVMDCLNGYYHAPGLLSLSEAFLKAPNGGAVAAFASSGLTLPDGQHDMSMQLYSLIYGAQPIALGDAIKIAKGATSDIDVRRTWIFFGDPSMKIR